MSDDPERVTDGHEEVHQDRERVVDGGERTNRDSEPAIGDSEPATDASAREQWADRTGEYSPTYYAHYGQDETSDLVRDLLEDQVGRGASVLELGCSVGRHLEHLRAAGFERLAGIDVNEDAADVMAEEYPELTATGRFYFDTFQSVLPEFTDAEFDAVFSVQTLQHLPPDDEWVLDEIARVAGEVLLTVEAESPAPGAEPDEPGVNYVAPDLPLYYRNWNDAFADRGFEQVAVREDRRGTARLFRRA